MSSLNEGVYHRRRHKISTLVMLESHVELLYSHHITSRFCVMLTLYISISTVVQITFTQWIIINQISWMSLFGGTETTADLWCTGSVRISTLPPGSTGEPVDASTETGRQEEGLFLVSRSIASPLSAWLVVSVIESSARSFLKWDDITCHFISAFFC